MNVKSLTVRALLCGAFLAAPLHADKVKVEVKVNGDNLLRELKNRELKNNILSSLSLEKENNGKLTPERIRKLYAQAPDEIGEALQPFGYFKPQVRPELHQNGTTWTATFDVDAGPPIKIASVDLRITGAGADDPDFQNLASHFPVREGEVFVSPTYEGAKKRLTDVAAANGYLDAAFQASQVRVDLVRYQADVILHYDTGPRYLFGPVYFHQNVLDGGLLTGYIDFTPGEPLDVNKVLRLQTALAESSYWARVEVVTRKDQAEGLEVPIEVHLVPAKPLRFSGGVGYGTDTGPRVKAAWDFRRINHEGHRAHVEANVSQIEQSLITSYQIPGPYPRTDTLSYNLGYDRQHTDTLQSMAGLIGSQYTFLRRGWNQTYALNFERESFTVGLDHGTSDLLVPSAGLERVQADDRVDTTNGFRARFTLQGTEKNPLSDVSFVQGLIDGKVIRTLVPRNRLIGRLQLGYTDTDSFHQLPPRFRFFAGGDQSVRGFRYQSLGPKDAAGHVIGGPALVVASLEYEYRFLPKWGAAVFYDTGNALPRFNAGELARGAGVGVRWLSPIGPVRADVAYALSDPRHPIVFHLNIGPDL